MLKVFFLLPHLDLSWSNFSASMVSLPSAVLAFAFFASGGSTATPTATSSSAT